MHGLTLKLLGIYGNTKEVPIAVSNQDAGSNLRGKDINIGKEIVDSLRKKNLGWKFVDEKQAIYGVERGDYYASITIPKDFSEKSQLFWMKIRKTRTGLLCE